VETVHESVECRCSRCVPTSRDIGSCRFVTISINRNCQFPHSVSTASAVFVHLSCGEMQRAFTATSARSRCSRSRRFCVLVRSRFRSDRHAAEWLQGANRRGLRYQANREHRTSACGRRDGLRQLSAQLLAGRVSNGHRRRKLALPEARIGKNAPRQGVSASPVQFVTACPDAVR
jgi:hypothetical protein